jgi:predicted Zn-dependent protease
MPDTVSPADDQHDSDGHLADLNALIASLDAARRARNLDLVLATAALLRQRFPLARAGYRAGAETLRELGRLDDAAALLDDAGARFDGEAWLLTECARLAAQRGDWDQATARLAALRQRFPAREDGYRLELGRLRRLGRFEDAAALLAAAAKHCAGKDWLLFETALLAAARTAGGKDATAPRRAAPLEEAAWRTQLADMTRAGRWADAEALLEAACASFPAARWALVERASLASARRTSPEIDACWAQAVAAFPDDPEIALRHAMAPTTGPKATRDPHAALRRLGDLHDRYTDFAPAWRAHIKTLRLTGSRPEAARLADECLRRMPDEPDLWLERAAALEDPAAAADCLAEAAARLPRHDAIQRELARALFRCGRFDAAEAAYPAVLARFPNSYDLACDQAEIAMRRRDWPEALRRWQAIRARFPRERRSEMGLLDTTTALGEAGVLAADAAEALADDANLYMRFQSLGGTGQGCEFGLVQRAFGAQPLSLLRWTHVPPENLIDALTNRFAGVGTREQTVIEVSAAEDAENPEYIYTDTRFKLAMHTFVGQKEMPEDEMFTQTCRRMTFLRRQLIAELEAGEKIFVYKFQKRNLTADELAALHRAVRVYGQATLLYVRYADADHPSGTVEQAEDGLLIGYISGFNIGLDNVKRPIDLPAWDKICRGALDLHDAAKARTGEA